MTTVSVTLLRQHHAANPTGDNRFGSTVTTAATAEAVVSQGDITEENVEQIIKAVLGRLNSNSLE